MSLRALALIAATAAVLGAVPASSGAASGVVFKVKNTNDDGAGSLRAAIVAGSR